MAKSKRLNKKQPSYNVFLVPGFLQFNRVFPKISIYLKNLSGKTRHITPTSQVLQAETHEFQSWTSGSSRFRRRTCHGFRGGAWFPTTEESSSPRWKGTTDGGGCFFIAMVAEKFGSERTSEKVGCFLSAHNQLLSMSYDSFLAISAVLADFGNDKGPNWWWDP